LAVKHLVYLFMLLKEVSSAHQGCIYLIKNKVKSVKFISIKNYDKKVFSIWIKIKIYS